MLAIQFNFFLATIIRTLVGRMGRSGLLGGSSGSFFLGDHCVDKVVRWGVDLARVV